MADTGDLAAVLEELEIRDYDEPIFEMTRAELTAAFKYPTTDNIDTSQLMRNLIWQDIHAIHASELAPIHGNLRSYWYSRVKPVLARIRAKQYAKKYGSMIDQFVDMVLSHRLFSYHEFGFTDEGAHDRSLGHSNRHIFCISEKVGHLPLLEEFQRDYDITILALGGYPSVLSSEYFLRELEQAGFAPDPEVPTPVFTIVDYDPSGDGIAESFLRQLNELGYEGDLQRIDLMHPSRMSHSQIKLNKFPLSRANSEEAKNHDWIDETGGLHPYGFGKWYGLEADAMSWEELTQAFVEEVTPYLDMSPQQIVHRRMVAELVELLTELLLIRLGLA